MYVEGGADTKVWFSNWFLIWPIKKAEPIAGQKEKGRTLGPRKRKRGGAVQTRLWNEKEDTTTM